MGKSKELLGSKVHNYVVVDIFRINQVLKEAGCKNAKALYKHEEESSLYNFSCVTEDEKTPFTVTLGNIFGIIIIHIYWTSDCTIGMIYDLQ